MKRLALTVVCALLSLGAISVWAQQKDKEDKPGEKKPAKNLSVVLGNSMLMGGNISKRTFDSLTRQGLKTVDPSGKIAGFEFNYKERNIYEDSVGNLVPIMELFSEYCFGDTLSEAISSSIYERTKRGDTAFFDNIKILWADGSVSKGKSLKFAIQ